jgi:signal transduction histidine kinase
MKKTLRSKYQFLLLIFFAIFILESALILIAFHSEYNLVQIKGSVQSIIILFMLVQFIFFVTIYYYIPYQYDHALKEIYRLIHEISEGRYQIDLEIKTQNQSEEISDLMAALQKMMNIIIRFDSLKADKIYEHHQRIQTLIKMIPQGCMIVSVIGEIAYMNDFVKDKFPTLSENMNILETMLPDYIEDGLKLIIIDSIKTGNNIHNKHLEIKSADNAYKISSGIIRNRKGHTTGAIFILTKA